MALHMDGDLQHSATSDNLEDNFCFCRAQEELGQINSSEGDFKRTESCGMSSILEEDIEDYSQDSLSLEDMWESVKYFNHKYQTSVEFSPTKFLADIAKGRSTRLSVCPTTDEGEVKENSQDSEGSDHAGAEQHKELTSQEAIVTQRPCVFQSDCHSVGEMLGRKSSTVYNSLCPNSLDAREIPDDAAENELQSALSEIPLICTEELLELSDTEETDHIRVVTLDNTSRSATIALDAVRFLAAEYNVSLDDNSNFSGSPTWIIRSPNSLGSGLGPSPMVATQHPAVASKALAVHNVPYYLLVVPAAMFQSSSALTEETTENEKTVEESTPKYCSERASTTVRVSPCPESCGAQSSSLVRVSRSGTPIQPLGGRKQQFVIVQGNNRDDNRSRYLETRNREAATQQFRKEHPPIYLQGLRPQGFQRLRKLSARGTKTATHSREFTEPSVHGVGKSPLTNVKQKSSSVPEGTEAGEEGLNPGVESPVLEPSFGNIAASVQDSSDTATELPNEENNEISEGEASGANSSAMNSEAGGVAKGSRPRPKRIEDREKKKLRHRKYDSEMKSGFRRLKELVPESRTAANRVSILNETEKYIEALQAKIRELYRQRPLSIYPTLVCNESLSPSCSHESESEAVVPEAQQIVRCESLESPLAVTVPVELTRKDCIPGDTNRMLHYTLIACDAEDEPKAQENDEKTVQSDWNIQAGGNQYGTPGIMSDSNSENTPTPSPFFVVPSIDLSLPPLLSPIYLAHSAGAFPEGHTAGGLSDQGTFLASHQVSEQTLYLVPTSPIGPFTEEVPTSVLADEISYQVDRPEGVETSYPYETPRDEAAISGLLGSTICEEGLSDLGVMPSPFQSPARIDTHSIAQLEGLDVEGSENSPYSPAHLVPSFFFESRSPGFTSVAASVEISTGTERSGKKKRRRKTRRKSSPIPAELPLGDKSNAWTLETVEREVRPLIDTTNQGDFSPASRRKRKRSQHNDWSREEDLGDENVHPNLAKVQLTPPLSKRPPGRPRKPAKKRAASTRGRGPRRGKVQNTPQQLQYNE